jgi:hypothetical protein
VSPIVSKAYKFRVPALIALSLGAVASLYWGVSQMGERPAAGLPYAEVRARAVADDQSAIEKMTVLQLQGEVEARKTRLLVAQEENMQPGLDECREDLARAQAALKAKKSGS